MRLSLNFRQIVNLRKRLRWRTYKSADRELFGKWCRCQKLMLKHFLQIHSLRWVNYETVTNKTFCKMVDLYVIRKAKDAIFNLLVRLFYFGRFKGRSPAQHSIQNYTN